VVKEGGLVKNTDDPDNKPIITKKWLYWTLAAFVAILVLLAIGMIF